jgi:hypothetical protein
MSNNKPTLIAYSVRERGKGKKDVWTRIGAAWPFQPIGDRIVLAEPKSEEPEAPADAD